MNFDIDSEFFDELKRELSSEERLIVAIMGDAFSTLGETQVWVISEKIRRNTLRWFESTEIAADWHTGFTFEFICEILKFDASVWRKKALAIYQETCVERELNMASRNKKALARLHAKQARNAEPYRSAVNE